MLKGFCNMSTFRGNALQLPKDKLAVGRVSVGSIAAIIFGSKISACSKCLLRYRKQADPELVAKHL
jgi:hypothetical protein